MRTALVAIFLMTGCHVTPGPAPMPPDASDASADGPNPCAEACTRLAAAGCEAGTASDCAEVLQAVENTRLVRMPNGSPLTCAATTPASVQGLGWCGQ